MADLPLGSLAGTPELDRWLALRDGRVVVRTGKAELGQGIRTAIVAVAADELGVDPSLIDVEGPATGTSPNEFITAGSGSIEQSAMAVRQACAHARRALLARAADHFGVAGRRAVERRRASAIARRARGVVLGARRRRGLRGDRRRRRWRRCRRASGPGPGSAFGGSTCPRRSAARPVFVHDTGDGAPRGRGRTPGVDRARPRRASRRGVAWRRTSTTPSGSRSTSSSMAASSPSSPTGRATPCLPPR